MKTTNITLYNMKQIFLTFLLLAGLSASSQICDGYYVKLNGDTVQCKIKVFKDSFGKPNYSFNTKKVRIIENEVQRKYTPAEIKLFSFVNVEGKTMKFVALPANKVTFFEEIIKGRLSLYYMHSMHPYDYSVSEIPVLVKDDKIHVFGFTSHRKVIGDLITDCPEIHNEWMITKQYDRANDIELLVKDYNNCIEKND